MMNQETDPLSTIAAVLGRLEERSKIAEERDERIEKDIAGFRQEVKKDNEIRNGRIGILETWKQRVTGGAVLLGLMSPLFVLGIRESIADLFK